MGYFSPSEQWKNSLWGKYIEPSIKDWLYGPWSKEKYDTYALLNTVPGVHQYLDYLLDVRADEEYLSRYGMDYSDIHDPRKLHQTGSIASGVGYAQVMFSKNIHKLYGR